MTYFCGACRIAVPIDGKGACSICGGAVRVMKAVLTKPQIMLSELPTFGWKAKFTDLSGIVHVGTGATQADAVFALFQLDPSVLPVELHEEKKPDDAV